VNKSWKLGKRALGWATGSGLLLLACGGAYTGGGTDENLGGSSSGGSASKPTSGGTSSSSRAGSQASAGTATGVAGGTMMPMPTPAPQPCFNDTDCPNSSCGGEVCNWTKAHPQPVGDKVFVCDPAGLQPAGRDGWCTRDENCKCIAQGARCIAPYCSFTTR
jgi:hypothetical protein